MTQSYQVANRQNGLAKATKERRFGRLSNVNCAKPTLMQERQMGKLLTVISVATRTCEAMFRIA